MSLSGLFSSSHFRRFFFLQCFRHVSTFLRSLRSTLITGFHPYYGRSDSCSLGSSAYTRFRVFSHELLTCSEQVSLIHRDVLPDHPVSNHPTCPKRRFSTLPLSSLGLRLHGLGFALGPRAHRHVWPNRVRIPTGWPFTSCAPHLASRRRSFIRLRAGERIPEGDFHPSIHRASQAHGPHASRGLAVVIRKKEEVDLVREGSSTRTERQWGSGLVRRERQCASGLIRQKQKAVGFRFGSTRSESGEQSPHSKEVCVTKEELTPGKAQDG